MNMWNRSFLWKNKQKTKCKKAGEKPKIKLNNAKLKKI